MRVLIVDDSTLIQQRLVQWLGSLPAVEVVGCAGDVAEAVTLIDAHQPHLIVLDVALRNGDRGLAVLAHARQSAPQCQVVVFSNEEYELLRARYLQAGASAYFDKGLEFEAAKRFLELASEALRDL